MGTERRPGGWGIRLAAALHLLTTLALSVGYLLPIVILASWVEAVIDFANDDSGRWAAAVASLPVAAAGSTLLARLACRIQRGRLENLYGVVVDQPMDVPRDTRWPLRTVRYLYGPDAWSAVLHSTVSGLWGLLVGITVLALVAVGVGVPLAVLVLALAQAFGDPPSVNWAEATLALLVAPLAVVAALVMAPAMLHVEASVTQTLLVDTPEMRARRRMAELSDSRLRMVDVAEAERRRIERDLHDGAQQQLLAVTMTLARARSRVLHSPEQAARLLDEAHTEAKAAMAELREVARGLHPRVLTDHGLESALPVAAGRCPVPVRVHVDLPERPSPRAEGVAYYVACEGLSNVAKHAGARTVEVRAERSGSTWEPLLRLTVTDDGRGGADATSGTGLAGLRDRARAVDGTVTVHSPAGGPTVLTAEVPWLA